MQSVCERKATTVFWRRSDKREQRDVLHARALALLRQGTGDPSAEFRDGQWEAIEQLVVNRSRSLVVQRTGWGKSSVYFIATKLLREQGYGPSLLISPLLSLMRNQILAAERLGLHEVMINSTNTNEGMRRSSRCLPFRSVLCSSRPSDWPTAISLNKCCAPSPCAWQ